MMITVKRYSIYIKMKKSKLGTILFLLIIILATVVRVVAGQRNIIFLVANIGSLSFLYLLAKDFLKSKRLGHLWMFIVSLSPWHVYFSSVGGYKNVGFFIFLASSWYSLARKKPKIIGAFGLVVALIFLLNYPLGLSFSDFSLWKVDQLRNHYQSPDGLLPTLFHNRYLYYFIETAKTYFGFFDGRTLFIDGSPAYSQRLHNIGFLYLFELPFLAIGLFFWIKNAKRDFIKAAFIVLLFSPILSLVNHLQVLFSSSILMFLPISLFVSFAILTIYDLIQIKHLRKIYLVLLAILYLWAFGLILDRYLINYL